MMQHALIAALSAVLIAPVCAACAEPAPMDRGDTTQEPEYLVWQSTRELRGHLHTQPDRVAAAELIVESALHEPSLSDDQRVNGLMIAASTLVNEGRYEKAIAALEPVGGYTDDPVQNARAHEALARAVSGIRLGARRSTRARRVHQCRGPAPGRGPRGALARLAPRVPETRDPGAVATRVPTEIKATSM